MKKLLIIFLFLISFISFAQTEIISVAYSLVGGYSAYYQIKDRELLEKGEREYKDYNSLWHNTQRVELGLSLALGSSIALNNKGLGGAGKDIILFSAIRWIIRDGVYNSLNGNPFFYMSPNTTAALEPFGFWWVKLSYLAFAIILKYIL